MTTDIKQLNFKGPGRNMLTKATLKSIRHNISVTVVNKIKNVTTYQ